MFPLNAHRVPLHLRTPSPVSPPVSRCFSLSQGLALLPVDGANSLDAGFLQWFSTWTSICIREHLSPRCAVRGRPPASGGSGREMGHAAGRLVRRVLFRVRGLSRWLGDSPIPPTTVPTSAASVNEKATLLSTSRHKLLRTEGTNQAKHIKSARFPQASSAPSSPWCHYKPRPNPGRRGPLLPIFRTMEFAR